MEYYFAYYNRTRSNPFPHLNQQQQQNDITTSKTSNETAAHTGFRVHVKFGAAVVVFHVKMAVENMS
jgi:hypothetical protein